MVLQDPEIEPSVSDNAEKGIEVVQLRNVFLVTVPFTTGARVLVVTVVATSETDTISELGSVDLNQHVASFPFMVWDLVAVPQEVLHLPGHYNFTTPKGTKVGCIRNCYPSFSNQIAFSRSQQTYVVHSHLCLHRDLADVLIMESILPRKKRNYIMIIKS